MKITLMCVEEVRGTFEYFYILNIFVLKRHAMVSRNNVYSKNVWC